MQIKTLSNPSNLAVTLADVKNFLKVSGSSEDDFITSLIKSATDTLEKYLGRVFITRSIAFIYNQKELYDNGQEFVEGLYLTRLPLQSVTSIKAYDTDGTEFTIDGSLYELIDEEYIVFYEDILMGIPSIRYSHTLKITCSCGYGADHTSTPDAIKVALMQIVIAYYESRGICTDGIKEILNTVSNYRVMPL